MARKVEEAKTSTAKLCEVLEMSYIGDRLCQPGEQVMYDPGEGGTFGSNLRVLEDEPSGN
ncbi:hypothetical protein BK645_09915 [Pseudomonas protegens]|uniref:hypothetical protein n=1 Tax=Pseudomonas protegens TaxID=380021 RepID=UPI0002F3D95C|nr:hypothetical protein [Pseudomonas protegens]ROM29276.1 hypothetical protein BK645_09915 [Pseudomonas protegens]ROM36908.1 hypothetical protein BK646_17955 [Pseudomonas protegens]